MKTFNEFFEKESKRGVHGMWVRVGTIRDVKIDGRGTLINTLGNVYDTADNNDYSFLLKDIAEAAEMSTADVDSKLRNLYANL